MLAAARDASGDVDDMNGGEDNVRGAAMSRTPRHAVAAAVLARKQPEQRHASFDVEQGSLFRRTLRVASVDGHGAARIIFVVFILFAINTINQWDRYLLNYLSSFTFQSCASSCKGVREDFCDVCPADDVACNACHTCLADHDIQYYNIRDATCLSLVQYGILTGFGFTALYVVASLTAGRVADVYSRKLVLGTAALVWSMTTALQSLVTGFWTLFLIRLVLGVSEAFAAPQVYSLISDLFAPHQRGKAVGAYNCGIYFGGGLASASLVFVQSLGWRNTSVVMGVAGVAVVVCFACVVFEPPRRKDGTERSDDDGADAAGQPTAATTTTTTTSPLVPRDARRDSTEPERLLPARRGSSGSKDDSMPLSCCAASKGAGSLTYWRAMKLSLANPAVRWLLAATAVRYFGGYTIAAFAPMFFEKYYANHTNQYAVANALVVSVGGMLSSFFGGYIADKWARRSLQGPALVCTLGCLLGVPFMTGVVVASSFWVAIACYFFEYLLAESWFGPAFSLMQALVPPNVVGVASSLFVCTAMLVGSSAPPILAAIITWLDSEQALRWMLLAGVAFSYLGAAACFFVSGRYAVAGPSHGDGSSVRRGDADGGGSFAALPSTTKRSGEEER